MTTFDALAAGYDAEFSDRPIARTLRAAVHDRLRSHVKAGCAALEIGCGTGIDAAFMATLGAVVTATDVSAGMLDVAKARAGDAVSYGLLDVNALPVDGFLDPYHVVLANFGALNGCGDFPALARWLSTRVVAGGVVCMAVMSRFCLWETVWGLSHLQPRRAARRWGGRAVFSPPTGREMTVFYPSVSEITRAFAPWFTVTTRRGLGVALPPSEMFGVIEKRPRWAAALTRLEARLWERGWGARLADHVWLEMVR